MTSPAQRLAALPPEQRSEVLAGFTAQQIAALHFAWRELGSPRAVTARRRLALLALPGR